MVVACAIVGAFAADAHALDDFPCSTQTTLRGWPEKAQQCPLTSPLAGDRIPVYTNPVANPKGHAPPPSRSFLTGVNNKFFMCERRFTGAAYYHPRGWFNTWWAKTIAADGKQGWVPEVFFQGGIDNESDAGLREGVCEIPSQPTPPPPPPSPPRRRPRRATRRPSRPRSG